ncbi:MAG TPA: tetratricopeptide repeat protein [Tepidisphaeraceae bacterium]|nr:tetratricopeptide repeat protein [Tepidisphaeraceae bacterium]
MSHEAVIHGFAALHRRGLDAFRRGDPAEAARVLQQSVILAPSEARLRCDLGGILGAMGRHEEAAGQFREAVRLKPDYADAWRNLGVAMERLGRIAGAMDAYRRAEALRPNDPRTAAFMGNALLAMGREDEAETCYEKAVALDPQFADAHARLGKLRHKRGRFLGAIGPLSIATRQRPADERSWRNLADCHVQIGDVEGFLNCCRQRLSGNPSDHAAHSAMLYSMHYAPEFGPAELYSAHLEWAGRHVGVCDSPTAVELPAASSNEPTWTSAFRASRPAGTPASPPAGMSRRRLRIGYMSPDFRSHTVTRFISPAIEHHDRERFEVICYSNSSREDETTQRLKQWASGWRDISRLGDEQACKLIREDRIDILIDLRGHGAGNRLMLFAQRCAPVQATMVGYFDTTGLPQMDIRITDPWQDPIGVSEGYHTERLIRLEESCWCYDPYGEWPEISDPPAIKSGHVTFGCLNKVIKVSQPCAELWAKILRQVPGSRLALVAPSADCAKFTFERLKGYGFPVARLDIWPRAATRSEYLERFNRIDISLDPFPFNGITTKCESLWMGVPVVSVAGATSVSRAGRSILHAAGLDKWAVSSPQEYVERAVSLAGDLDSLSENRRDLRDRLRCSPLLDGPGFAQRLGGSLLHVCRAGPHPGATP